MVAGISEFIWLYGPPGVGKTVTGRALAEQLALPFVDLDARIAEKAGMPIPQIFSGQGEPAFRAMESAAIRRVLENQPGVVALGGGALLDEENRKMCEESGQVVVLTAGLETLKLRVAKQDGQRPLLSGAQEDKLTALLRQRKAHYGSFPCQISTDDQTTAQTAGEIAVRLGRYWIMGMGAGYPVVVGDNAWQMLPKLLEKIESDRRVMIVTDHNVGGHYLEQIEHLFNDSGWACSSVVIPAGEGSKTLKQAEYLWGEMLKGGLGRHSLLIALGGGVVSDLAGFAASAYMRGIRWACLPTSLLSMVDASLGGKTGVDLPAGKNLVGAFHPPQFVLTDTTGLATLPEREWQGGLAEVVKHGVIADPQLFQLCEQGLLPLQGEAEALVRRAMRVKVEIINQDPYEQGIRASLNLGHTIGHAVEHLSGFRLSHGEAVAIGTVAEARLAEEMALAEQGLAAEIAGVLTGLGLPVEIPQEMDTQEIIGVLQLDKKKKGGKVRFALPVQIGQVSVGMEVNDLSELVSTIRGE